MSKQEKIRWAPRISQAKIRQLYGQDAQGIVDEELIDEVGTGLYARAESIIMVSNRQLRCPRCRAVFQWGDWEDPPLADDAAIACSEEGCGWETTFQACRQSWRRRRLFGGGIQPMLEQYMEQYPRAGSPRDKMLLIDWLLHTFHHEIKAGRVPKAAACNLIEGKAPKVVALLDELTYGDGSTPGLRETREAWRRELRAPHAEQE
jgi:hypothetical protein